MTWLRKKPLMLPVVAFLVAVLALAVTLFFLTMTGFRKTKDRLVEQMYQKGLTLIRTVEAGTRSGMMSTGFGGEFTDRLFREVSAEPGVEHIRLVNGGGGVIASSDGEESRDAEDLPTGLDDGLPRRRIIQDGDESKMLIYKKFRPPQSRRMGRWGGRNMMDQQGLAALEEESYVILSLSMRSVEEAGKAALKNAYLSGLILLLVGIGGIVFFGMMQNYYLLRRTLAATRSYADRIVDSMADGLVAVDAKGTITVVNGETARLLSMEHGKLVGYELGKMVPGMAQEVKRSLTQGEMILDGRLDIKKGEKQVKIDYSVTPIREDEEVAGAVILLRDVSEVEELRGRLKEKEKLAALGEMAAAVAHEVRNPLSSIKGFAQVLSGKLPDGSPQRQHTSVIIEEVNRLNRFVEELLLYVKPTRPNKVRADLRAILQAVAGLVREEAAAKGVDIVLNIPDSMPDVLLDDDLFKRALFNMIINSMEAMDADGGTITVTATAAVGGPVVLTVADTGPGLPADEGSRIFQSFYSTKPGGTGLGLSIVRQIMDGHGWSYDLRNAPGGGAVNTITIPGNNPEEK